MIWGHRLESTNYIESVWGQFKISTHSVYHTIPGINCQQFLDEFLYKRNLLDTERNQAIIELLRLEYPI